ncbi:hypothetical protein HDU96_007861 [Phlyctochytrium bullatum]|nr:hypothetical protein HDU96_007861 [Phlyctochytrium bullatum]
MNRLSSIHQEQAQSLATFLATSPSPTASPESSPRLTNSNPANRRHNIRYILCSPFSRCIQTVLPLSIALGIPIAIEPGLSEWFCPTSATKLSRSLKGLPPPPLPTLDEIAKGLELELTTAANSGVRKRGGTLDADYSPVLPFDARWETDAQVHDRFRKVVYEILRRLDEGEANSTRASGELGSRFVPGGTPAAAAAAAVGIAGDVVMVTHAAGVISAVRGAIGWPRAPVLAAVATYNRVRLDKVPATWMAVPAGSSPARKAQTREDAAADRPSTLYRWTVEANGESSYLSHLGGLKYVWSYTGPNYGPDWSFSTFAGSGLSPANLSNATISEGTAAGALAAFAGLVVGSPYFTDASGDTVKQLIAAKSAGTTGEEKRLDGAPKLEKLRIESESNNNRAEKAEGEVKELKAELAKKDTEVQNLKNRITLLEMDLERAEKRVEEVKLKKVEGDKEESMIDELQRKVSRLEQQLEEKEKSWREATDKARSLEVQAEHHERKAKQIDNEKMDLEKKYEDLNSKYLAVKAELDSTLKSLEDL